MRWKSIAIIFVLLASLIPFSPARAADQGEELEVNVHLSLETGSGQWSTEGVTCVSDSGDVQSGTQFSIHGNDITCWGTPTFTLTWSGYAYGPAKFSAGFGIHKLNNNVGNQDYWMDGYMLPSNADWETVEDHTGPSSGDVGYSLSGAPNNYKVWQTVSSPSENEDKEVMIYFRAANHEFDTDSTNIDECENQYTPIIVITTSTILANSETGLEFNNLTNGKKYELTIEGGPWNDGIGNASRYDTAVKEGESSWVPTDEYAANENINCNQLDPNSPFTKRLVFTAIDSTFAVRVNDTAGDFADNTYGSSVMQATIKEVQDVTSGTCAGQFLQGQLLGTGTISATNSTGVNLYTLLGTKSPAAGDWFIIQVSGAWKNNGAGDDLQTLAMKHTGWVIWEHLATTSSTGCHADTTYYVQQTSNGGDYWLRVDDSDGNFSANTGTVTISIYGVAQYSAYQSGCELQYTIGDLIETKQVQGNLSNGIPIDNQASGMWDPIGGEFEIPFRYYMLETFGGPVDLGAGDLSWDVELGESTLAGVVPSTYYDAITAPFVECYAQIDPVGHYRFFFTMDEQTDIYTFIRHHYGIRIADLAGTYSGNSGSIGYRLYEATDQQNPGYDTPSVDGCLQFHHESTATSTQTLAAHDNPTGISLGTFDARTLYAIDITGGPWLENGSDRYDTEISDDGGVSWTDLIEYGNILCSQSADGDHLLVFLQGAAGKVWRLRANDQDASWANNTGSLTVTLYGGNTQRDGFPKCDDDYTLTTMSLGDEARKVPGNISEGKALPGIVSGNVYAVEITGESKWYENGTGSGSYLVDISDDGGATWSDFEGYTSLCTMVTGNGGMFKVYFTATSSTYKLRVRDGDTNFLTNTGMVYFNIYSAVDKTNPGSHSGNNTPPPEWVVACTESYTRPNSVITWASVSFTLLEETVSLSIPVIRFADWIEYAKNAVVSFFAWCPQHTSALMNMGSVYTNKEPIASFLDLMKFWKDMQTTIEALTATGGESADITSQEPAFFSDYSQMGATGGEANYVAPAANPLDLFIVGTVDRTNNPMYGGQLDLTTVGSTDMNAGSIATYRTYCSDKFSNLFGIATDTFCTLVAAMRFTQIVTWVLMVVDLIAVLWYVFKYFPGWVRKMWASITGHKRNVGDMIRLSS